MNKRYYNNKECYLIAELPDGQSVIEIETAGESGDEDIYIVPVKIIVNTKDLTLSPVDFGKEIKKYQMEIRTLENTKNGLERDIEREWNKRLKEVQKEVEEKKKAFSEVEKVIEFLTSKTLYALSSCFELYDLRETLKDNGYRYRRATSISSERNGEKVVFSVNRDHGGSGGETKLIFVSSDKKVIEDYLRSNLPELAENVKNIYRDRVVSSYGKNNIASDIMDSVNRWAKESKDANDARELAKKEKELELLNKEIKSLKGE